MPVALEAWFIRQLTRLYMLFCLVKSFLSTEHYPRGVAKTAPSNTTAKMHGAVYIYISYNKKTQQNRGLTPLSCTPLFC